MSIGEKIKIKRTQLGITQEELATMVGFKSKSSINKIETGERDVRQSRVSAFAKALGVGIEYLMTDDQEMGPSNIEAVFTDHIRMIPVYESVSAGFGTKAHDSVIDYLPIRIVSDYEADETICIRVSGDSMHPKIEDGAIIQVHRQTTVDSGDIAVVLIDDGTDEPCGYVKRVVYGKTWIELHSANPEYTIKRFDGEDVQKVSVVGKVKGVYNCI
jgi:repressor LexA